MLIDRKQMWFFSSLSRLFSDRWERVRILDMDWPYSQSRTRFSLEARIRTWFGDFSSEFVNCSETRSNTYLWRRDGALRWGRHALRGFWTKVLFIFFLIFVSFTVFRTLVFIITYEIRFYKYTCFWLFRFCSSKNINHTLSILSWILLYFLLCTSTLSLSSFCIPVFGCFLGFLVLIFTNTKNPICKRFSLEKLRLVAASLGKSSFSAYFC